MYPLLGVGVPQIPEIEQNWDISQVLVYGSLSTVYFFNVTYSRQFWHYWQAIDCRLWSYAGKPAIVSNQWTTVPNIGHMMDICRAFWWNSWKCQNIPKMALSRGGGSICLSHLRKRWASSTEYYYWFGSQCGSGFHIGALLGLIAGTPYIKVSRHKIIWSSPWAQIVPNKIMHLAAPIASYVSYLH